MTDIDALLPGLTFELPETDTVLPSSSPLKDICTGDELESIFNDAQGTLVALKPTIAPYYWVLAACGQIFGLDIDKTGPIQDLAAKYHVDFVVEDVFNTKKSLQLLGLSQDVDCLNLQHRILYGKDMGEDIPVSKMVGVFQKNAAELERLSNVGWYERMRGAQALALSPGFVVRADREPEFAKMLSKGVVPVRHKPCGTYTGRITTAAPNAQGLSKEQRQSLYAPHPKVLISADYRQMQPRILSGLSGDKALEELLQDGGDIYKFFASMAYDKQPCDITDEERKVGKLMCLGLVYGMEKPGLAKHLRKAGIDDAERRASQIHDKLKETFSTFYDWQSKLRFRGSPYQIYDESRSEGEYKPLGLKLPSQDVLWYQPHTESARKFANNLAQRAEIEIVADAVRRFAEATRQEHLTGTGFMLCVHDELIIYCNEREAPKAGDLLKQSMEEAFLEYPQMPQMRDFVRISEPSKCWGDLK